MSDCECLLRDIVPGTQPVFAESSKFNILRLGRTPIETLHVLRDDLSRQCGDAGVTGIVARSSAVFALVGVIEKTEFAGYCAAPEIAWPVDIIRHELRSPGQSGSCAKL